MSSKRMRLALWIIVTSLGMAGLGSTAPASAAEAGPDHQARPGNAAASTNPAASTRDPATQADDASLPVIPVGQDALRSWDHWPRQRIGARAYMRSTYDRHGGNRKADAANFLYQLDEDYNVTLDVKGRGVLYFARYNFWHGSPWHYEVDGTEHLIDAKSPKNPRKAQRSEGGHFVPRDLFPKPLCWTHGTTHGANLMWRPIPFENRFRMGYSYTHYGTGYYIYHLYNEGANLSQPIESWQPEPPAPDVLDLLGRAGEDIAPKEGEANTWRRTGTVTVPGDESVTLARLDNGPMKLRALKLSVPRDRAIEFGNYRIRITWDGREHPSIEAPVNLFFGAGTFYNRGGKKYLVKGLPINVRFEGARVHLACYFPMPYFRSATIALVGPGSTDQSGNKPIENVQWELRGQPYEGPANHVGYFHATYNNYPSPKQGFDMVWLDTNNVEGGGPWSGQIVGTTYQFTDEAFLPTLEGDPRFFLDGSLTPQAQGTGSEEWGGGGNYWGGLTMSLPLAGHPVGAPSKKKAKNKLDLIHSAYRFLLADLFPFGRRAVIRFEHGGENQSTEHYKTVVYWYGLPEPSLVKTDTLNVGDTDSEEAHDYDSPEASKPYTLTSRYEWGVRKPAKGPGDRATREANGGGGNRTNEAPAVGVESLARADPVPVMTRSGRITNGTSTFTLDLKPDNHGVVLRRTLDYKYPNQQARVLIAPIKDDGEVGRYKPAGLWYLAGSNTYYHSYPPKELDPPHPKVMTSPRRFRDDEFLVPKALTRGRDRIRVRIEFTPITQRLLPDRPLPAHAWSAMRYTAYCWVEPAFDVSDAD